MTFTKDPSTHPAHGPLTEERLIRVRDELAAAAKRSDGGNLGYMMADAAKAIEELLALRKAEQEPVAWPNHCDSTIPAALRFLAEKPRPIYGNSPYNTEHLYQLAREIEMITRRPLYAAPQLPQPAVVNADDNFYSWFGREWHENYQHNQYTSAAKQMLGVMAESAWRAGRSAAMLQGADPVHDVDNTNRQFESLGCAEDTSRRFKCTGLIFTSDERKMEIPHCSKHPETELQVHPFEQLMSYPPQPVMYCPLCRPSVAKWVEFDNQLRQWKGVK